jgi:hypothetical protein
MNLRRGSLQLWVVVSVLWIGLMTLTFSVKAITGPHFSNDLVNYVLNAFGLPLAMLAIGFVGARVADRFRSRTKNG